MAKNRIATITGTMLAPGVSKNRRLYTREIIEAAVADLQNRLADPANPATMLTHHLAGDDSTRIVGRIAKVWLTSDGTAKFESDIADTDAGRDIATLVTADKPYLSGVSIRGHWVGDVRTEMHDGEQVETADGLVIDGLDFTKTPGVPAARIESASLAETAGTTPITESVQEAHVTITEDAGATEADKEPYGDVVYADPGYQSDGKKRYPLDTKKHIRAAWSYINQADNAKPYTSAQLKRIKGRIKSAAKKVGINVAAESAAIAAAVTEALEEAYASMCLDNGEGTVSVSGYTNEPAMLAAVGKRVALAALAGIDTLDPDNDGDIDCDPDETDKDDDDMESTTTTPAAPVAEDNTKEAAVATETTTAAAPQPPKPLDQMSDTELREWAAVFVAPPATEAEKPTDKPADETAPTGNEKPADESASQRTLSDADIAALAAALKGTTTTESAPEAGKPAVESEKTVDERIAEAVEKAKAEVIAEASKAFARTGRRRGLVRTEETQLTKPLHEMDNDELREYARPVWDGVLPPAA